MVQYIRQFFYAKGGIFMKKYLLFAISVFIFCFLFATAATGRRNGVKILFFDCCKIFCDFSCLDVQLSFCKILTCKPFWHS